MSQQELLIRTIASLEAAGVGYFASGSVASSLQGEPRSTHDLDFVVAISPGALPALLSRFPTPDFYVDPETARGAVERRTMFNLIEVATGEKVDFWLLTDSPFDRSRFARKREETLFGRIAFVSSPEDTIMQKLAWSKRSGFSEKQFGDCLRVFEVQFELLDQAYMDRWARELGVLERAGTGRHRH